MNSAPLRNNFFDHKGKQYEIRAQIDTETGKVSIRGFHDGNPVLITYPDGSKATLVYHVALDVGQDITQHYLDLDAVTEMMNIAEEDIKRLI